MGIRRRFEMSDLQEEADQYRSSVWAVNLADLMTFLMIFFLMLFSFYASVSMTPEVKTAWDKNFKSIEKRFGSKPTDKRIAAMFPKKTTPFFAKEEKKAPEEKVSKDVSAGAKIALAKPIIYPYSGKLSKADVKKMMTSVNRSIRRGGANISAVGIDVTVATDEVAYYTINEINLPISVVKDKVASYTVERGDTLWKILIKYSLDPYRYREIAKYNKMHNPSLIVPGQIIKLKKLY